MATLRSLFSGFLTSIFLLTSSYSTICQACDNVCDASTTDQNCQTEPGFRIQQHGRPYEIIQAMTRSLQESDGGFFNEEKISVRRRIPSDSSSPFGIFAKEDISSDELLMKFPAEFLIRIEPTGSYDEDICLLKDELLDEMNKGEDSQYKNYIDFLILQTPTIPAAWSDQGRFLLHRMLTETRNGVDRYLPPRDSTALYDITCYDDEDEVEQKLLHLTVMNGYDTLMAPIYDIINHSNHPNKVNVKNTSVKRKQGFEVSAMKSIKQGEELLHSYNHCFDCDGDSDVFGTPEVFRNHGFVEDYPQRYELIGGTFDEEDASYDIVREADNSLSLVWLKKPFFNGGRIPAMRRQLQRLERFRSESLMPAKESLDKTEWSLLNEYYEAFTVALSLAVSDAEADEFDEIYDSDFDPNDEYVLPEDTHAIQKLDNFRDAIYQSETLIWASQHFHHIDSLQSEYQSIEYYKEPKTKDVCFYIDSIFQMCGSYWPYYHEMQVHKAAKYVKESIKRVLFVGAGDNGLLNEIVKYPSLELVVGLELDQHVSRMAFKHLAAKPHFDNPKVQWWFGDASKTLFMLPKEYFGSFDMVLVDLSDTVLSLTVSGELDVVGALSLLLRPGGVFSMNELFFRRVSDVFKHTLYYQFTDVPKVLDQGFVFASNDIDLLNQDLTDHKLENVHVEDSILKTDHRFIHVHDYRHNPNSSSQQLCKDLNGEKAEPSWQDTSPGIFMAIEAEELESLELGLRSHVQSTIESALTDEGFRVIESTSDNMTDNIFITVMEEGYVTVRLHKEEKYVAFDTLLWSSFNDHEALKRVLVESVGGSVSATSSFRVVTGGMFGTISWKRDRKSHGPEIANKCPEAEEKKFVKGENIFSIALEGTIDLVQDDGKFSVGILCPAEGLPCESIDVLKQNPRVDSVAIFHACSAASASKDDKVCSIESFAKTMDTVSSKIRALVVDPACPPSMEDLPFIMKRKDLLESNVLAMATISSRHDLWRRQLVDRIRRKVVPMDPVFRAHVVFNSTSDQGSSSMELAITSSGDELFIEHLKESVAKMQEKSGFNLHVSNILGGLWRQETRWVFPDNEASKIFLPEDYDQTSAMDQYLSQQPMGIQTVVQLHNLAPLEMNEEVQYTLYLDNDEDFKSNVKAIDGDGSYTVFDFFGDDLKLPRFRLSSLSGDRVANLTASDMKKVFDAVFVDENDDDPMYTNTFEGIGDGIVFVAIWEDGQVIMVWDGRHTVALNVYCKNLKTFQFIQNRIQGELPTLKIHLLDIHPRGYGRVVNFATDTEQHPTPHWFDDVETAE